jgi:hypothetical protein
LKGEYLANTSWPGASSTLTGLVPQPTTELENDLGTKEHSFIFGYQIDRQEEEGLYSLDSFPFLHVTKQEICMGYACFKVRFSRFNQSRGQVVLLKIFIKES